MNKLKNNNVSMFSIYIFVKKNAADILSCGIERLTLVYLYSLHISPFFSPFIQKRLSPHRIRGKPVWRQHRRLLPEPVLERGRVHGRHRVVHVRLPARLPGAALWRHDVHQWLLPQWGQMRQRRKLLVFFFIVLNNKQLIFIHFAF